MKKTLPPDQTRTDPRYQTLFENTGTATILIEENMVISMANSETAAISGIPLEKIINKMKFFEMIADADKEKVVRYHHLRRKHPDRAPRNYPCKVKIADNKILESILTVAMVEGTGQSIASITDISRQRQLEREITRISDQERLTMGQALHDDLGSHLAGVDAMATLLKRRLEKENHPEAALARDVSDLINQAIAQTRAMVKGLMPIHFESKKFINTLVRYCREVEKAFGIKCTIDTRMTELTFEDASLLNHLFSITRESINNAAKHSSASHIIVRINDENAAITIEVTDNGKGMTSAENGMGLDIMHHRADLIGAELAISTHPEGGTTVLCRIPKPSS